MSLIRKHCIYSQHCQAPLSNFPETPEDLSIDPPKTKTRANRLQYVLLPVLLPAKDFWLWMPTIPTNQMAHTSTIQVLQHSLL